LGQLRRDADPGVDDDGPVGAGDDRVQVQFRDFGQIVGQPRHPQQRVAQRRVGRPRTDRVDQHIGVVDGQGRQSDGVAGGRIGCGPGRPEHHQRSEHLVVLDPDRHQVLACPRLGRRRRREPVVPEQRVDL
jgi:hypothetical protein